MDRASLRALAPAFGLGLAVAASHGIGRFGYALLLPAMREDLGWSYLQASWMNTANALGYVGGAMAGYVLLRTIHTRTLFASGLLLTVLTVALTGLGGPFEWLFVMRLLAGFGTAWAFSCGSTIVTELYAADPKLRGYAAGVFFGCAGIGMILTAVIVPALTQAGGAGTWRTGWFLLGGTAALLAFWPLLAMRAAIAVQRNAGAPAMQPAQRALAAEAPSIRANALVQFSYFLFAVAHTAYIFFVFAWLRSGHADWRLAAAMWIVLGAAIFASGFAWQRALAAWHATSTMALTCAIVGAGSALPLLAYSSLAVIVSAVLVGSSLFIVPAAVSVLVRQQLPPAAWGPAMMHYTVIFSLGQAVGSWATGWLADVYSLATALSLGSAGLLLGAACAAAARALSLHGVAANAR
jgi:predicted MFS family arabinose efflux permease